MRLPETASAYGLMYGLGASATGVLAALDLGLVGDQPLARQAIELWGMGGQHVVSSLAHLGTAAPIAEMMAAGIGAFAPFAVGGAIGWAAGKGVQAIFKVPVMAKMRTHLGHFFDRHTNSIERQWAERNKDVLRGVLTAKGDHAKDGKEHYFWIDDKAKLHEITHRQYLMFSRVLQHESDVQIQIDQAKMSQIQRGPDRKLSVTAVRPRLEMAIKPWLSQRELASILKAARVELTSVVENNATAVRAVSSPWHKKVWEKHRGDEPRPTATAEEISQAFKDEDHDDDHAPGM